MKAEGRFKRVVEAAPCALILVGVDGRVEMINAEVERIFGRSRTDILGSPAEILLPEKYLQTNPLLLEAPLERTNGALGRGTFDAHGLRADGSKFPIRIKVTPIEASDGAAQLWTLVDVSESHQSMSDAAYLAAIVASSDDAIIGKDLTGTIKSWNRAAETIFGYSAKEMIGESILRLFPLDRLDEEATIVAQIRSGTRVEHFETIRRHRSGADIAVSLTVSPIRDASGVVVGASKIVRDITAQKRAQQDLARSEAEFRASFESLSVGKILAQAESRRIVRVNGAVARILGYEPAELVGRACSELSWPEDLRLGEREHAQLLSGACETYALEQRYRRRDGGPIWVRVSAALARVKGDPSPNLVVIAIEDIDDRHKAREDLLEAKKDLERVVAERTAALSQRDVLLREVYRRVKNNLQIVDGLLMIESQKTTDDHAKAVLTGIRERVFSLGLVHQQLMNSEDLKRFNVAPFLRDLCRNLADGGPDHDVRVDCDSCDLQVDLDFAVPLGLIVTELVTNSIKHAFHVGGGVVSVSLRRDEGGDLVLIVSDDGQGPASAPPSHGRNGLGSSILRSLVAQLDGQMKVMCELGLTTEIRIKRPACS